MSNKKLTILAVTAVIMIILAVIQARIANRPVNTAARRTYLIQGLNPDKIARIEIESADNRVELIRTGATFTVADKDNYPAKSDRINELFTQVMDIKTAELITGDRANHAELEVTEDKAQYLVKLLDEKDRLVTGTIIGERAGDGSSYVRLVDSNDVYLTSDTPWLRPSPMDYIDTLLIKADRDDIVSVTVTDTNGLSYTLESGPDSSEVTLSGQIPQDKKLNSRRNSVFSALTSLRFDDVMKESSVRDAITFNRTYLCKLKDSTVYILKIAKSDDKTYLTCTADFQDNEEVTIDINKQESDQELKRKEAILLAREAVDKLNRKCRGWVYSIPSYKAENLTKPLDELLDDIQPENEEEPNSP